MRSAGSSAPTENRPHSCSPNCSYYRSPKQRSRWPRLRCGAPGTQSAGGPLLQPAAPGVDGRGPSGRLAARTATPTVSGHMCPTPVRRARGLGRGRWRTPVLDRRWRARRRWWTCHVPLLSDRQRAVPGRRGAGESAGRGASRRCLAGCRGDRVFDPGGADAPDRGEELSAPHRVRCSSSPRRPHLTERALLRSGRSLRVPPCRERTHCDDSVAGLGHAGGLGGR